ncbi:MAG: tripartite tricarboxylate transporter TctB family protein [Pseudomonadota bacterium]
MVDRIFAGFLLAVTLAYGAIAFAVIKAPFQYDPLGPESWPRILAIIATACLIILLWKPDVERFDTDRGSWLKIGAVIVILFGYAALYEPLGFIISTFLFSTLMARMLGSPWLRSGAFGVAAGVVGYLVCAGLLDLNLPAGPLPRI